MQDIKAAIINKVGPFELMERLTERADDLAGLIESEGRLHSEIYGLEQRQSEIEFDVRGIVNNLPDDELKDPATGRKNVDHTEYVRQKYLQRDAEYVDIAERLNALRAERIRLRARVEATDKKYSAIRHVSRLAAALMEMESTL